MKLAKENLQQINNEDIVKPTEAHLQLPEKVLQFGTGVLLRGLPDYFIDKANRAGLYQGHIVVVKSTEGGDAKAFDEQDHLYTLCIRGIEAGKEVEENIICSAISRVLSAKQQWQEVLQCAASTQFQLVISNTTEVGIQMVKESIFQDPPHSFPAKLLAALYARFKKLGNNESAKMVVLPTELITDNGKKLRAIVMELAQYNKLENEFFTWLDRNIFFCNTLVDCIVPGTPESSLHEQMENSLGYTDKLLIISEVYRLWAIEGGDDIKSLLSFAQADARVIITPDITRYKELKLRLLNGTHTLSCGIAFLAGMGTVKTAMGNQNFADFISGLMLEELAPAIPYSIPEAESKAFGLQVLDRFRNPHLQHQWLSITMQYTSKMAMRNIPLLLQYFKLKQRVPQRFALGFAAYLLFMKAVKKEDATYWGEWNDASYPIRDDQAAYYFDLWQNHTPDGVVHAVLKNIDFWGTDISQLNGFEESVQRHLQSLLQHGPMQTLEDLAVQEG